MLNVACMYEFYIINNYTLNDIANISKDLVVLNSIIYKFNCKVYYYYCSFLNDSIIPSVDYNLFDFIIIYLTTQKTKEISSLAFINNLRAFYWFLITFCFISF